MSFISLTLNTTTATTTTTNAINGRPKLGGGPSPQVASTSSPSLANSAAIARSNLKPTPFKTLSTNSLLAECNNQTSYRIQRSGSDNDVSKAGTYYQEE